MQRERLVPLLEWARREGMSESLARKWIKEGRVEAVRLGHYWYIPEVVDGPEQRTQTYTLFTHAGGAGKTSLARDVGFELASRGYRVLLVDADPQANLTAWLGVDPARWPTRKPSSRSFARMSSPVPGRWAGTSTSSPLP